MPELPLARTVNRAVMGASREGAERGVLSDALAEWAGDVLAAGQALPSPRTYQELLKAGEHGVGTGGVVAHIPLILETGKLARANISLDAGLLADIDEAAARRGVTRSAFLAAAARDKIRAGA